MSNPVGWFEIYVQDMPRARAFYEAVFQRPLSPLPSPGPEFSDMEMMAFAMDMTAMGASGALVRMEGFESGDNSVIVYFSCADVAVEEARVVPAGGTVMKAKMSIGPYGFIALVTDTEGNIIGLHSQK